MKVLSCIKLLCPGDRAPASAKAEGLGFGILAWRPRMCMHVLPCEWAGLAVISNYLITDISVPASFFIGCFCITSGYEKKQYSVMARQDQFFPPEVSFCSKERALNFQNVSLAWHHKQNMHHILTNPHAHHSAVEENWGSERLHGLSRSHGQLVSSGAQKPGGSVHSPQPCSLQISGSLAWKATLYSLSHALLVTCTSSLESWILPETDPFLIHVFPWPLPMDLQGPFSGLLVRDVDGRRKACLWLLIAQSHPFPCSG